MSVAKILVPLTGSPEDSVALATAFAAAKPFHPHVSALFVHADPREVASLVYSGATVSPEIIQNIVDDQQKLTKQAEGSARSALQAAARDAGAEVVAEPARLKGLSCSLQVRLGFIPHVISEAALLSDLVILRTPQGDNRSTFAAAIVETLTQANRPVVLPGRDACPTFAQRVAIGWDGSNAAAHAAIAALSYLEWARSVEILTVRTRHKGAGGVALKDYLRLHGIESSLREVALDQAHAGDCLVEAAVQWGADLLVMGGYGHSHLREAFLGGVTLDVVNRHSLPVFLMH
jgi:nucleotide-binding universal stress UspA family protein